jgi:hypothetical protein
MNDAIDIVIAMYDIERREYDKLPKHSIEQVSAHIRLNALCDVVIALRRALRTKEEK